MNQNDIHWEGTKLFLDQVCKDIGLEWSYDDSNNRTVCFKKSGMEGLLESCFGDSDKCEMVVYRVVLVAVENKVIEKALRRMFRGND